jgi:hypothetical protein
VPNELTPHRCPGCRAVVAEGVEARGSRWHPECLTRATLEEALAVSSDSTARASWGAAPREARERVPGRVGGGRPLVRLLQWLLAGAAVIVFVGAIYIMLWVAPGPNDLATRVYVGVGALVILGALDTQYGRLVSRSTPLSLTEAPEERRYRIRSALLLIGAAVTLGALALRPDIVRNAVRDSTTVAVILSLLALAVVGFGLPRAPKCRQPERWRSGVVATAVGLVLLWVLPLTAMAAGAKGLVPRELGVVLVIAALVVAVSLIGGGMDAMAKANNTPKDDSWDIF